MVNRNELLVYFAEKTWKGISFSDGQAAKQSALISISI